MDNFKCYDEVMYIGMSYLYKCGNNSNYTLNLVNLNLKNKEHLCLLEMARTVKCYYGFKVCVKTNVFNLLKIKIKYKLNVKPLTNKNRAPHIDCASLVKNLNQFAVDNIPELETKHILSEIYKHYYEKGYIVEN